MTHAKQCMVWAVVAGTSLSVFLISARAGEEPLLGVPGVPPDGQTSEEVYLDDSFAASDAIADARKLARSGRWTEAAELLQRTAETAHGQLIRITPRYYVGLCEHISEVIAGWPKAGVHAYQSLYEREVAASLESAGPQRNLKAYLTIFDRYFCTKAAANLADTIGQLAMESGNLSLARRVYQRVLDRHPNAVTYESRYRATLALIAAMEGDDSPPDPATDLTTTIRWKGEDHTLSDVLSEIHKSFSGLQSAPPARDWPMFGGRVERNAIGSSSVDELGLLWRFETTPKGKLTAVGKARSRESSSLRHQTNRLTMQPVVSDAFVYVQRYREIIALYRSTGVEAWRYRVDEVPVSSSDLPEQPPRWDAVTVKDGRVYAAIPGDIVPYYGYESARTLPMLLCLDAATGKPIWSVGQDAVGDDFSEVSFDSAPIVRGGHVFVIGRRRRSFGFEDCYLYRFDVRSGAFQFRTHIGSASTGTFGTHRPTSAIAAMHGDTLYVCSNLGSVAAVWAHSGTVRWLRLYDRVKSADLRESSWNTEDMPSWTFNPVIYSDEKVILSPTDARAVFVLSARDGHLLQTIQAEKLGDARMLLGVHGDVLCTAGTGVSCFHLTKGTSLWSRALSENAKPRGRGMWVDDQLLLPTNRGVSVFQISDGRQKVIAWNTDDEGGNLLATPDGLLVAGADVVSAYVRKADLWKALRERMAAAPSDPVPALEMVEVALRSGDYAEALTVLDEAVKRAGGFALPIEPALKRRLFDDTLTFVDRLSEKGKLTLDGLHKLFRYVSQCPPDREAHLWYRFHLAPLFERAGEPDRALRLYHQILRDRSLRALDVSRALIGSETALSESAGAVAQSRIAELIHRHGDTIYEPFASEAKKWLESARATRDATLLQRVVQTFPNSEAAPLALLTQAQWEVDAGRFEQGARRYSKAYQRYPRRVHRAHLLRQIADAYEQAGRITYAYRWLTKATREFPDARIPYEGRMVSFRTYRDRLSAARSRVMPSRPRVALPLEKHRQRPEEDKVSLLSPRFGEAPSADWSQYYLYTRKGLMALAARTNREVWPKTVPARAGVELLVATARVVVFATSYQVFGLDRSTGAKLWSVGQYPAELNDENADWEGLGSIRTHALQDDHLVTVHDDGRMTCISIETGTLLWSQTHLPAPLGVLRLAGPWGVYYVRQDGHTVLCRIDATTGEWIGATITDSDRPVEDLIVPLDGQVIVVTSQSLTSYDVEAGVQRWKVSLQGHLRVASLRVDIDALYYSDDGQTVRKINLESGETRWQSEPITEHAARDLTVQRQGANLMVSSIASVGAIDEVSGLTLWRGTVPEEAHFVRRMLTDAFVAAVHVPDDDDEAETAVYFYDYRNGSGVLAREGGVKALARLSDVRQILLVDDTLVIQAGSVIHTWSSR